MFEEGDDSPAVDTNYCPQHRRCSECGAAQKETEGLGFLYISSIVYGCISGFPNFLT